MASENAPDPEQGFLASVINAATKGATAIGMNDQGQEIRHVRSNTIAVDGDTDHLATQTPELPRRRSSVGSNHVPDTEQNQALGEGTLSLEELERGFRLADNLNLDVPASKPAVPPSPQPASAPRARSNSEMTRGSNSADRDSDGGDALDHHNLISGFAVASKKRNEDFHALFRSVPEEDHLIDDYGAALQREILIQGRLYVSENHICFNANILGWVTNLILAFSEVVAIERKNTALIIPNAIQITTLHNKHVFASFISRDTTADLLMNIWRLSHPSLIKGPNGDARRASHDFGNREEEEREEDIEEPADEDEDDEEEDGDEDESEEGSEEETDKEDNAAAQAVPDSESKGVASGAAITTATAVGTTSNGSAAKGPMSPTSCDCSQSGSHYNFVCLDKEFPSSIESLFNLLFKSPLVEKMLAEKEKATELDFGQWSKGDGASRKYSYIKALGGSIGPKSTKCYLEDKVLEFDFNKAVTVMTTTSTPDVPSGSSFSVKTRNCITWNGPTKCRLVVTSAVEWTKSSFLKSVIDRSALDGQKSYMEHLDEAIRAHIRSHPGDFLGGAASTGPGETPAKTAKKKGTKKTKKRKRGDEKAATKVMPQKQGMADMVIGAGSTVVSVVKEVAGMLPSLVGGLSSALGTTDALLLLIVVLLGLNVWATFVRSASMSAYEESEMDLQDWLRKRSV